MKNYKVIVCVLSVLALTAILLIDFDKDGKEPVITDAMKFKSEYEELNGKEAYGVMKYSELEISEDNPIKYSNATEIEKVLEDGSGIIYLGYPNCPWCRTAVPILLTAAMDAGVDKIYYVNMSEERDSYVVKDGEVTLEKKGTDQYYKLLELFDEYLDDYIVKDDDGKEYSTDEKRIYVPVVFFVKDGEIIGMHLDTVESQTNPFQALTKEQTEELYGIYTDYIHDMLGDLCTERC